MRIGQMANAVGWNASTIRYYEKIGLLAPPSRNESGYRDYSEEDARRLALVARARMLSLPLDEVRLLVDYAVDGRCGPLRTELLAALKKRAADTRRQIRELRILQRELDRVCADLAKAGCEQALPEPVADSCTCLDGLTSSVSAEPRTSRTNNGKEERQ